MRTVPCQRCNSRTARYAVHCVESEQQRVLVCGSCYDEKGKWHFRPFWETPSQPGAASITLTEPERRFVLGAVKSWGGRYDPFSQALLAKLQAPDNQNNSMEAGDAAGGDAGCEDLGE